MKTAKIELNYDFEGVEIVEIENYMAPLLICASDSGKIEIEAQLDIHSFVPGTDIAEYFNVNADGHKVHIELEFIPELYESMTGSGGESQVTIRVPIAVTVKAEGENMPIRIEGLQGKLDLHNENGPLIISNCGGEKDLETENGPIKMNNCSGNVKITLENGPLSAEKVSGESIIVESENGPIKIRSASFQIVKITNENGVIYYETLPLENGNFSFENENGVVQLSLPEDLGFVLDAETETGVIQCSLEAEINTENDHKIIRRGDGNTRISVSTENGVIKINANNQPDLSFLKLKMDELGKTIRNAVKPEDKEQVIMVLNTVTASIEKAMNSISEVKVKEGLSAAMDKLKKVVEDFDVKGTKDKVVETVEQIGDEVVEGLKTVIRKVKDAHSDGFHKEQGHLHKEIDSLKDYIHKVINSSIIQPYLGKGMNTSEKQEVDDRSRIKILEMLESGKITAEEAERLLKAIGKE